MPSVFEFQSQSHSAQWRPAAAEDGSSSYWIPVDELLTSGFLARHTAYSSFQTLFDASGLSLERFSQLDERIDHTWEAFIRQTSRFSGWTAMLRDARGEWLMRRLGIAVGA